MCKPITPLLGSAYKLGEEAPIPELCVLPQRKGEGVGVLDDIPCIPDTRSNSTICAICSMIS